MTELVERARGHAPGDAVRDDRDGGRFEVAEAGLVATLDYRHEAGDRLVLARTQVPPSVDGPGHRVGGRLLAAAVDRARAEGLTLVPACPFARRWLRDNPEAAAGITVDWSGA